MSEREEYFAGFDPGRETEIEEAENDAYDVEVERELIREANERKSALTQLREALEQMRLAANRINKATWLWRNDGHN